MRLFRRPSRTPGIVTLVIDDGPSDLTPRLLDMLENGGHRAVMFVLGCNIEDREAMLVDAIRRGFALGNHSFDHPHFSQIGLATARTQIERTEALLDELYASANVDRPGQWFRFPFLDSGRDQGSGLQALLRDMGFEACPGALESNKIRRDWQTTIATRDWDRPSSRAFVRSLRRTTSGDVIEFHDKLYTVDRYTPALVRELAALSLRATIPGMADA